MFDTLCTTALLGLGSGFFLPFFLPKRLPKLKPSLTDKKLSVIIPARNEEVNIAALLQSLKAQTNLPQEIIVIDDHSTDQTSFTAKQHGGQTFTADALPPAWTGKNWACHQGVKKANGDLLLFLDADVRLAPTALEAVKGRLENPKVDVLSVLPYHHIEKLYENLSAFFNILMALGSGSEFLTGPMMAVSKKKYLESGGHEAVKDKILENFFLSHIMREKDFALINFRGQGQINYRMYPGGLKDLIEGWIKAFSRGAQMTSPPLLAAIILWLSGLTSTFILLTRGAPLFPHFCLYVLAILQVWYMLTQLGSFKKMTALLYPISLFFFFAVFSLSLLNILMGKKVSWRGRDIPS